MCLKITSWSQRNILRSWRSSAERTGDCPEEPQPPDVRGRRRLSAPGEVILGILPNDPGTKEYTGRSGDGGITR